MQEGQAEGAKTVVGCGIDLVEVERIRRARERWGERFLVRLFTPGERAYCAAKREGDGSLAARFAAKEAVAKALGLGLGGFRWREIEVVNAASGRPAVRLAGATLARARALGVEKILLSLSHTREHALAQAMALKAGPEMN
ncbi:holo-ACP synthase [Gelria sp. Kuro-4]|uniref:holo-ACP synthase n=1 Tax=Gelria sp. Kuro-4 TaxID=2796927 RepID=UPI001BEFFAC8|nr:holo-ACP synthase [Gelria sp. Kuro-4]BCV24420.1 holo-[acyl-carrier-protein] synthase [Gelria sp. Kuro-4]